MINEHIKRVFGAVSDSASRISEVIDKKMEGKLEAATLFAMDKISKGTNKLIDILDKKKED